MTLTKVTAFIKRDFQIETSYKLAFILWIVNSAFPIISYFFIGRLMEGSHPEALAKYGTNYFSFVLIGISFTSYFTAAITIFSGSIRRAQMAGCLEAILSSQTNPRTIVLMSSFYSFISSAVIMFIMFIISILFFGFDISNINIPSFLISFLLSLVVFISLGIFSASGTIVFKQGDPFQFIFGALSSLLGGAVFPVSILPDWLKAVSDFIPITYSLDILRFSILKGYGIGQLSHQFFILLIMAVILFPLSLQTFNWAVNRGKRTGTLMDY